MTDRLDDIRVLITGAASGIGAACARRMARDGARLLLADLNGERRLRKVQHLSGACKVAGICDSDKRFEMPQVEVAHRRSIL